MEFLANFTFELVAIKRASKNASLVGESLDLEQLRRPEQRLESVGLDVDLTAVDVADEALDVGVARVAEDDHRVRARVFLTKKSRSASYRKTRE